MAGIGGGAHKGYVVAQVSLHVVLGVYFGPLALLFAPINSFLILRLVAHRLPFVVLLKKLVYVCDGRPLLPFFLLLREFEVFAVPGDIFARESQVQCRPELGLPLRRLVDKLGV